MLDKKHLQIIYESAVVSKTDYFLLEDVSNFDWSIFFERYAFYQQTFHYLLEDFKKVLSNSEQDVYEIQTKKDLKFNLYINFLSKDNVSDKILSSIVSNLQDESIRDVQKVAKLTKHPIVHVAFEDENKNTHLTNKVGLQTFSVLGDVEKSLKRSFNDRLFRPDLIIIYIKKEEPRRLEVYKRFFKQTFANLTRVCIDETASKDYNLVYCFCEPSSMKT
jgi:hypothetical protein